MKKLPEITDIYVKNAYAKRTVFPLGACLQQHVHDYDHFSFIGKGKFRLMKYSLTDRTTPYEVTEHSCGEMLVLKAGVVHEVFALEPDSIWYCIHGLQPNASLADVDVVVIADNDGNRVEG